MIFLFVLTAGIAQISQRVGVTEARAHEIVSPIPAGIESPAIQVTPAQTTEVEETDENEQIREYIKEVFGSHADTAFKLLSCENSKLNPDAVNTAGNYPEGSRDIGVFQINEFWQKTQGKFLFNWRINVQIAHQLYTENGNSFKLWTCGKNLNI